MIGYWLAKIPRLIVSTIQIVFELFGLLIMTIKQTRMLVYSGKRRVFWSLFSRQLYNVGLNSILIVSITAILLSWLVISRAYSLLPENSKFEIYYAQFFVIVVIREIAPLFTGLLIISRSATAVTFEIGHLKLHNQFEAMQANGMNPIFVFLLPVLFAFPLCLSFITIYFIIVCFFSSYLFITFSNQASLSLASFTQLILSNTSSIEISVMLFKTLIGGVVIGLVCVYMGTKVSDRFTDISRSITNATSIQLLAFFGINVALSLVIYL